MPIQYLHDAQGRPVAVLAPIDEWNALLEQTASVDEELTPEEAMRAEAAWAEYKADPDSLASLEDVAASLGVKLDD